MRTHSIYACDSRSLTLLSGERNGEWPLHSPCIYTLYPHVNRKSIMCLSEGIASCIPRPYIAWEGKMPKNEAKFLRYTSRVKAQVRPGCRLKKLPFSGQASFSVSLLLRRSRCATGQSITSRCCSSDLIPNAESHVKHYSMCVNIISQPTQSYNWLV